MKLEIGKVVSFSISDLSVTTENVGIIKSYTMTEQGKLYTIVSGGKDYDGVTEKKIKCSFIEEKDVD